MKKRDTAYCSSLGWRRVRMWGDDRAVLDGGPSTTTWSPAFNPDSTTQRVPTRAPRVTCAHRDLIAVDEDAQLVAILEFRDRALRHEEGVGHGPRSGP